MTISATTQGIKPGVCTSTNRPSAPFDGQVIYMTDVDQTAVWDGTQWTVLAPIAGERNGIINGAMNVWQRGTSSASQGYVTADRWFMLGASTTFSQETSDLPSNFRYALKCTMSGTAQPFSMQAIETQNSIRFAGKTVVLSYYVKTSNSTDAFLRIDTSNNVDETIQGSYSVIASTSVATTTSWTRVSATFSVPSTSKTLRILVGSNSNLTSGQTILITGVQLEAGAVATPFEFEDYATTLAKCQRYYYRSFCNYLLGAVRDTNLPYFTKQFPVTMRTAPSFSSNYTTRAPALAPAAAGEVGFFGNGWYTGAGATAVALDSGDTDQESFYFTGWTGTAGQNLVLISNSFTWFAFSAEL